MEIRLIIMCIPITLLIRIVVAILIVLITLMRRIRLRLRALQIPRSIVQHNMLVLVTLRIILSVGLSRLTGVIVTLLIEPMLRMVPTIPAPLLTITLQ